MQVAYCSAKEFAKLKPCPDTVVINLTAQENAVAPNKGWKHFLVNKFEVLDDRGVFAPIDNQAKELAHRIFPYIKDAKKVICQCEYGEIRSPAVATGISWSTLGDRRLMEIVNGQWADGGGSSHSTFMARTYGWIDRTIDDLVKKERDEQ